MAAEQILVKEFNMGDCEDPYLYAAFPLQEWQDSDEGKYVMTHSKKQPVFYCNPSIENFGYKVQIYAWLDGEALTFYNLKYRNHNDRIR